MTNVDWSGQHGHGHRCSFWNDSRSCKPRQRNCRPREAAALIAATSAIPKGRAREGDPVKTELDTAMKRIGELTVQVELLEAKTETGLACGAPVPPIIPRSIEVIPCSDV